MGGGASKPDDPVAQKELARQSIRIVNAAVTQNFVNQPLDGSDLKVRGATVLQRHIKSGSTQQMKVDVASQ